MASPTFVANYNLALASWDTTGANKTLSVSTDTGDALIVYAVAEDLATFGIPTGSGATFTELIEATVASRSYVIMHGALATATSTWTLTHPGAAADEWGFGMARFTASDGAGNSAISYGTGITPATPSLTTTADNSSVVLVFGDWNAGNLVGRVWPTMNGYTPSAGNGGEKLAVPGAGNFAMAMAVYPDVGAAGVKNFGAMTGMSLGGHVLCAVEVKGGGAPPPPPPAGLRVFPSTLPYQLGQVPDAPPPSGWSPRFSSMFLGM